MFPAGSVPQPDFSTPRHTDQTFAFELESVRAAATASEVLLGSSGVRGPAENITPFLCAVYTGAHLRVFDRAGLLKTPFVGIGGDLRSSTDQIMSDNGFAILRNGLQPKNLGKVGLPIVANWAVVNQAVALMVTGGNSPTGENGMTWCTPKGEVTRKLAAEILDQEVNLPPGLYNEDGSCGVPYNLPPPTHIAADLYKQRYLNFLPPGALDGVNVGVIIDSSVTSELLADLYECLGAKVTRYDRDPSFRPIDTEAIPAKLRHRALELSHESSHDMLLGTDADGDAPIVFDAHGRFVSGAAAGMLTAYWLKADAVAASVSSNTSVARSGIFKRVYQEDVPVGSMHILHAMEQAEAAGHKRIVGYENNGGFLVQTDIELGSRVLPRLPARDSAIVHLALMSLVKKTGWPLNRLVAGVSVRETDSGCLTDFNRADAVNIINALIHSAGRDGSELELINDIFAPVFGPVAGVNSTDGLRLILEDGNIVHMRASTNSNRFRCYTEADTAQKASELLTKGLEMMKGWEEKSPL